jgi:hypothetical protein
LAAPVQQASGLDSRRESQDQLAQSNRGTGH